MNQNLLYILIFAVFIYIVLDNSKETFYESFMPHDPSYYIDSCRRLTQEQNQVKKLELNTCNKNTNTNDPSRRTPINSGINCHNLVEKDIMLNNEQPSWCSKITPEQLESIKQESNPLPTNTSQESINPSSAQPVTNGQGYKESLNLFEGPLFLENDFKNNLAYDRITANYSSI